MPQCRPGASRSTASKSRTSCRRKAAFRDAEARERSAAAEAKATELVSDAIAKGQVASINYFIADKYLRALTEIAHSPNQKILMLPIEATSVLGSLAGIAEIAKATFGGNSGGTAVSPPPRPSLPPASANPPSSDTNPRS